MIVWTLIFLLLSVLAVFTGLSSPMQVLTELFAISVFVVVLLV